MREKILMQIELFEDGQINVYEFIKQLKIIIN